MNFFKSIILDDPDPPKPEGPHESRSDSPIKPPEEDRSPSDVAQEDSVWSFGGLIKTLATRSESVIDTYSRDLKEFGSGLRKETEIIREAASRAVQDLPASIEAGTSAASGMLDGVLKSTAGIISKEAQDGSDGESETPETNRSLNRGRYSWYDAHLSSIRNDPNTFSEEPEDVEEYNKWKSSFQLDSKSCEIEDLIGENGNLEGAYKRVVPNVVDQEAFWCRYFYRVDKLKQQEKVRVNLVKRAIAADEDDDELSWEVDDDEEEKNGNTNVIKGDEKVKGEEGAECKGANGGSLNSGSQNDKKEGNIDVDGIKINVIKLSVGNRDEVVSLVEQDVSNEVAGVKSEEILKSEESVEEGKSENVGVDKGGSGEKRGVSETSNHQVKTEGVSETLTHQVKTEEEDEVGWDEIEDIGIDSETKISTSGNSEKPNGGELRQQFNVAEDDEDLSWEIEDDDDPVKS